jgi:threonine dehydrogenase-like Zn-dependent dehydrogenase
VAALRTSANGDADPVLVLGAGPIGLLAVFLLAARGRRAVDDFETALVVLAANAPRLEWMTVLGLDAGAEAFRRLVAEPDSTIKVVLSVDGPSAKETSP